MAARDRASQEKLGDLAALIAEVCQSCEATSREQAAEFRALHAAVTEHRERLQYLTNVVMTAPKISGVIPPFPSVPACRQAAETPEMPVAKRQKQGPREFVDVLYGQVDVAGDPRNIARTAVGLVAGLIPGDVVSAKFATGRPGLDIRQTPILPSIAVVPQWGRASIEMSKICGLYA